MNAKFRYSLFVAYLSAIAMAADPVLKQAGALLDTQDYAGAAALLENAAKASSRDPEVYLMLAVARMNLRQPQGAVDACDRGLKTAPGSARLESYCTGLLVQAVAPAEIVAHLDGALAAHPGSGVLKKALGKALLETSPNDVRVEALLRTAATALPADPDAHYSYGQWACMHEKSAVCITEMQKTLSLSEPSNFRASLGANTFIAMAEESQEHFDAAARAYRAALDANRRLTPFNPDPAFQYVRFLQTRSEDETAAALVEEILRRAPHFAPARFERAKALFREGLAKEAAKEAETCLEDSTGDKTELRAIRSFLVKTYSVLGQEADAARHQAWVEANR